MELPLARDIRYQVIINSKAIAELNVWIQEKVAGGYYSGLYTPMNDLCMPEIEYIRNLGYSITYNSALSSYEINWE